MINYNINFLKIRDLREGMGLSKKWVAMQLQLTELNYADKERGHGKFTLDQTINLAKMFGVRIEDLTTPIIVLGGINKE